MDSSGSGDYAKDTRICENGHTVKMAALPGSTLPANLKEKLQGSIKWQRRKILSI